MGRVTFQQTKKKKLTLGIRPAVHPLAMTLSQSSKRDYEEAEYIHIAEFILSSSCGDFKLSDIQGEKDVPFKRC